MRYLTLFITLCVLSMASPLAAQKQKSETPSKVTEMERSVSTAFADALRDFYAADYSNAEKKFRNVIAKNSQHHTSFYMLSKIKVLDKNYSDAISYLNEALKIDKKNDWYKEELARIYDLTGNYEQSAALWLQLSKSKPTMEIYLFSLADAYLNQQKYTDVIKVYDKLEILLGFNEDITEAKKNIWLYLNKVKNAVGEYDRLIAEFPEETNYYVKAGNIYLANDLPEKAWPYYQKALTINPNHAGLQYALYDYYRKKGAHQASYEALIKVLQSREFPLEDKLPILRTLITNYLRPNSSINISKEQMYFITDIITEVHPFSAEGWAQLATLKLLDQQYSGARNALEKVIAIDISRYSVWEDYLFVLSQLKDYNTIISIENQVLELFPANAIILYSIGVAYLNEAQPNKALSLFNQAITYAFEPPLIAGIYNMMGNAYLELSQTEDAVKYWKLAKKKGLNSQELNEKLSKYE